MFVDRKKLPFAEYSVEKEHRQLLLAGVTATTVAVILSVHSRARSAPHGLENFASRRGLVLPLPVRLRDFVASAGQPSHPLAGLPSRSCERSERPAKAGGEYRSRTGDLLVANQALSQLS